MRMWLRRVWYLLNRRRHERDLMREMHDHRAAMTDPYAFGDPYRLLERARDEWGWNWLDDAMQDFAVGMRTLLKAPSFAITATLILSFGIGLNVTLYQMVGTALLRPPAIKDAREFARFHRVGPNFSSSGVAYPIAEFVKHNNSVLAAVLVESGASIAWGQDAGEHLQASFVSPNWFDEIGYGPLHGRVLNEGIDTSAAAPAVVLGYTFWLARLGADPNIVGTTVYLDRKPVTVAGVAPQTMPGVNFGVPDLFLPITQREYFYPQSQALREWQTDSIDMYGRFKPGLSADAVREGLRPVMQAIAAAHREVEAEQWLQPLLATDNFMRESERRGVLAVLAMIGALTTMVLVVAAANLGNLVISRAMGRVRELGVRMALGARRSRIVRQLIVESLPLVGLGTAGSLVFTSTATGLIARVVGAPPYLDFSLNWRAVLLATALAALVLGVVGVLPAWKIAQQRLIDAIKDGGHHISRALDRARMRRLMMASQVAGSCLLLIVAGMMVRSLQRVLQSDAGFDYQQAAVLDIPLDRYGITGDAAQAYWQAVKERVKANPAVEDAAIVTTPPLGGRVFQTAYDAAPRVRVMSHAVDPEYFRVMGIPIIAGRAFGSAEPGALVVGRRLAFEMYGTDQVLGEPFPKGAGRARSTASGVAELVAAEGTIVGVAADAHAIKISATDVVELYAALKPKDFSMVFLVARARTDADRLPPILREAATLDPRVIARAHAMHEDFDRSTQEPRIASAVAGAIGLLTLALACLGIFGVVSYGVALRTKEIGIRVALGASQPKLLGAILQQLLTPVTGGVIVGGVLGISAGHALSGEPFYLESDDPLALLAPLAVFAAAGAIAALWPALATLKRNPIDALRHQ